MQTFFLSAQRIKVVVCVTQVVGHWDETEASDVSVVASLVELFLGCVVTGEPLSRFCQGRKKSVSRILWLESLSGECLDIYSPTCGDLKGPSFSCFSNSASEVLVIISWNPNVKQKSTSPMLLVLSNSCADCELTITMSNQFSWTLICLYHPWYSSTEGDHLP